MEIDQIKSDLLQIAAMYDDEECNDDNIVYATFAMIRHAHEVAQMLLLEGRFGEMQRCLNLCRAILGTDECAEEGNDDDNLNKEITNSSSDGSSNGSSSSKISRNSANSNAIESPLIQVHKPSRARRVSVKEATSNPQHYEHSEQKDATKQTADNVLSQVGTSPHIVVAAAATVTVIESNINSTGVALSLLPHEEEQEYYSEQQSQQQKEEVKRREEKKAIVANPEQTYSSTEPLPTHKTHTHKETHNNSSKPVFIHHVGMHDLESHELHDYQSFHSQSHSHSHSHRRAVHSLNAEDRFLFTCLRERTEQLQHELDSNRLHRKGRDMSYYITKLQINNSINNGNSNTDNTTLASERWNKENNKLKDIAHKSEEICWNDTKVKNFEKTINIRKEENNHIISTTNNFIKNNSNNNTTNYQNVLLRAPAPPERGIAIAAKSNLHQYKLPRQLPPLVTSSKPFFKEYLGNTHNTLSNLSVSTNASHHSRTYSTYQLLPIIQESKDNNVVNANKSITSKVANRYNINDDVDNDYEHLNSEYGNKNTNNNDDDNNNCMTEIVSVVANNHNGNTHVTTLSPSSSTLLLSPSSSSSSSSSVIATATAASPTSTSILRPTSRQWRKTKVNDVKMHTKEELSSKLQSSSWLLPREPYHDYKQIQEHVNETKEHENMQSHTYIKNNVINNVMKEEKCNKSVSEVNPNEAASFDVHVLNFRESTNNRVDSANSMIDRASVSNSFSSVLSNELNEIKHAIEGDTTTNITAINNLYNHNENRNNVNDDDDVSNSDRDSDDDEEEDEEEVVNVDLNKSMISVSDLLSSRFISQNPLEQSGLPLIKHNERKYAKYNKKVTEREENNKVKHMSHSTKLSFHGTANKTNLQHERYLSREEFAVEKEREYEQEKESEQLDEEEQQQYSEEWNKNRRNTVLSKQQEELHSLEGTREKYERPVRLLSSESISQSSLLLSSTKSDCQEIDSASKWRMKSTTQARVRVPQTRLLDEEYSLEERRRENQRLHRKHSSIQRSKSILSEEFKARRKAGWNKETKTSFCFGSFVKIPSASHSHSHSHGALNNNNNSNNSVITPTPMSTNKYKHRFSSYYTTQTPTPTAVSTEAAAARRNITFSHTELPLSPSELLMTTSSSATVNNDLATCKICSETQQEQEQTKRTALAWSEIQHCTTLSKLDHMCSSVHPFFANTEACASANIVTTTTTANCNNYKNNNNIQSVLESLSQSAADNNNKEFIHSLPVNANHNVLKPYQTVDAFLIKNALAVQRAQEVVRRTTSTIKNVGKYGLALVHKRIADTQGTLHSQKVFIHVNDNNNIDEIIKIKSKPKEEELAIFDTSEETEMPCGAVTSTASTKEDCLQAQEDQKQLTSLTPLLSELRSISSLSLSAKRKLNEIVQHTQKCNIKLESTYKTMTSYLETDKSVLQPREEEAIIEDTITWRKKQKQKKKNNKLNTCKYSPERIKEEEQDEKQETSSEFKSKHQNEYVSSVQSIQSSTVTDSTYHTDYTPEERHLNSPTVTITTPTVSESDGYIISSNQERTNNNIKVNSDDDLINVNISSDFAKHGTPDNKNVVTTTSTTTTSKMKSEEEQQLLSNSLYSQLARSRANEMELTKMESDEESINKYDVVDAFTAKEYEYKTAIEKLECGKSHALDVHAHNLVIAHLTSAAHELLIEQENAKPRNMVSKLLCKSRSEKQTETVSASFGVDNIDNDNDKKTEATHIDRRRLRSRMEEICHAAELKTNKQIVFNSKALLLGTLQHLADIERDFIHNNNNSNDNNNNSDSFNSNNSNTREENSEFFTINSLAEQPLLQTSKVKTETMLPELLTSSVSSSPLLSSEHSSTSDHSELEGDLFHTRITTKTDTTSQFVQEDSNVCRIWNTCPHDTLHEYAYKFTNHYLPIESNNNNNINSNTNNNNNNSFSHVHLTRSSYVPLLSELQSCRHWVEHLSPYILQNCLDLLLATIQIQRVWRQYMAKTETQRRQANILASRHEEIRWYDAIALIQRQVRILVAQRKLADLRTRRDISVKRRVVRERRSAQVSPSHTLQNHVKSDVCGNSQSLLCTNHTNTTIYKSNNDNNKSSTISNNCESNVKANQINTNSLQNITEHVEDKSCPLIMSQLMKRARVRSVLELSPVTSELEAIGITAITQNNNHNIDNIIVHEKDNEEREHFLEKEEHKSEELLEEEWQLKAEEEEEEEEQEEQEMFNNSTEEGNENNSDEITLHDKKTNKIGRNYSSSSNSNTTRERRCTKELSSVVLQEACITPLNLVSCKDATTCNERSNQNYNLLNCTSCDKINNNKNNKEKEYDSYTIVNDTDTSHSKNEQEISNKYINEKSTKRRNNDYLFKARYSIPAWMINSNLSPTLERIQQCIAARVILNAYKNYCRCQLQQLANEVHALNCFVTQQCTAQEVWNNQTPFCGAYVQSTNRDYANFYFNKYQTKKTNTLAWNARNISDCKNNVTKKQKDCNHESLLHYRNEKVIKLNNNDNDESDDYDNDDDYDEADIKREEEVSHTPRTPDGEAALRMRLLLHRYSGNVCEKFTHRMQEARRQGDYRTPLELINTNALEHIRMNKVQSERAAALLEQAQRRERASHAFREQQRRIKAIDTIQRTGRGFMRRRWMHMQLTKLEERMELERLHTLQLQQQEQRRRSTWASNARINSWYDRNNSISSTSIVHTSQEAEELNLPFSIHAHVMRQIQRRLPLSLVLNGALPERRHAQLVLVELIERFALSHVSISITFRRYVNQLVSRIQRAWRRHLARRCEVPKEKQS